MKVAELSKITSKRTDRTVEYAAPASVVSLLREYSQMYSLPIFEMLRVLSKGSVQSVSFTKDSPYFRFYARAQGKGDLIIKLNIGTISHEVPLKISSIPHFDDLLSKE